MRILIADDDALSRRVLEVALDQLGHDTLAVEDGEAALAALAAPDSPRLAIVDWMMPGLDGLTLCRRLRQAPGPYTYVILLTARRLPADVVEALDAGADDYLAKPLDRVELRARLQSGIRVITLQQTLLQTQNELLHLATHDRLTGLWNRAYLVDALARESNRAGREQGSMAVAMVDIDHFKRVNDVHGHAVGDAVLQQVALRMTSVLRTTDVLGRYGGEEFLIVLPASDTAGARQVAERVRAAVSGSPVPCGSVAVPVTVTIGVASSTAVGFEPAALVQACDEELYRGKAAGRNRVEACQS